MQAGVGAVDDVDVTAVVGLDVVRLNGDLAALLAVDPRYKVQGQNDPKVPEYARRSAR
jgi:hypothetical protein